MRYFANIIQTKTNIDTYTQNKNIITLSPSAAQDTNTDKNIHTRKVRLKLADVKTNHFTASKLDFFCCSFATLYK